MLTDSQIADFKANGFLNDGIILNSKRRRSGGTTQRSDARDR